MGVGATTAPPAEPDSAAGTAPRTETTTAASALSEWPSDSGVFVANAFGREAMGQGAKSAVGVKKGESLRLVYGAMLHNGKDYDRASEYKHFTEVAK